MEDTQITSTNLRIGELASKMECAVETIRYYEREGLIPTPKRSAGNYRLYGHIHVERMRFIRRCRALDMTLNEIRALLSVHDTPKTTETCRVSELIEEHLHHVEARLNELNALREQLVALNSFCKDTHASDQCAILSMLEDEKPLDDTSAPLTRHESRDSDYHRAVHTS